MTPQQKEDPVDINDSANTDTVSPGHGIGRIPWAYRRRHGKGVGKPDQFMLEDADGRYLGTVVLGDDADQERLARTACKTVNSGEAVQRGISDALTRIEMGIRLLSADAEANPEAAISELVTAKAVLIVTKMAASPNGGNHA